MLKEEKELWERLHELLGINAQLVGKHVTAFRRAIYEDAARRVDNLIGSSPAEEQLLKALALWDQQWVCRIVNKMRKEIVEECAKVADKYVEPNDDVGPMDTMARIIAAAIRRK